MITTTAANKDENILEEKVNGAEFFFAVADANDVPMEDDSVDISLSVFAPRNGKEIERTMKKKARYSSSLRRLCIYRSCARTRRKNVALFVSTSKTKNPNASKSDSKN